jgi:hypothetical protein
MNEETGRVWNVRLGILAQVLAVLGVVWGIWKFTSEQTHQTEQTIRSNSIEFERSLWKEQLTAYAKIADVVGRIAASVDDPVRLKEAITQFRTEYWGAMVLAEDEAVEAAMIAFNQEVADFQSGWSSADRLRVRAVRLLETCRQSSRQTWRNIKSLGADFRAK